MHSITSEPCMLGFWNFIYGFFMKKYLTRVFFPIRIMPLSWVMALWKNIDETLSAKYLKSYWKVLHELWPFITGHFYNCTFFDAQHKFWPVHARVLKFHIWIPHEKIADTYLFLIRIMPLSWVMALWKKYGWNLVSKISQKLLKLEPWNLVNRLVLSRWPDKLLNKFWKLLHELLPFITLGIFMLHTFWCIA